MPHGSKPLPDKRKVIDPDHVLRWSIYERKWWFVREALEAGANPNQLTYPWSGQPCLSLVAFTASVPGQEGLVRLLLEHGADPNVREETGGAALHCAANAEMVEILLAAGADPQRLTEDGDTVLHRCHDPEVAERLIEAGADPLIRNHAGRLPYETCSAWFAKERERLFHQFDHPKAERLLDLLRREAEAAELRAMGAGPGESVPPAKGADVRRL